MMASLRESKAKLSEYISRAAAGEEFVITVRGKPMAKLVPVFPAGMESELRYWAKELKDWQREGKPLQEWNSSQQIVDELRKERW